MSSMPLPAGAAAARRNPPSHAGTTEELLIDAEVDSQPAPRPTPTPSLGHRILLGASVVLIAFNLRPVFASLSVVLPEIIKATGLSATAASLLQAMSTAGSAASTASRILCVRARSVCTPTVH